MVEIKQKTTGGNKTVGANENTAGGNKNKRPANKNDRWNKNMGGRLGLPKEKYNEDVYIYAYIYIYIQI